VQWATCNRRGHVTDPGSAPTHSTTAHARYTSLKEGSSRCSLVLDSLSGGFRQNVLARVYGGRLKLISVCKQNPKRHNLPYDKSFLYSNKALSFEKNNQ
jgi:hypothetical protein